MNQQAKQPRTSEQLAQAAKHISHSTGAECPECGSRLTEDNGAAEYRCMKCDHRWGTDMGEQYGF